MIFLIVVAAVAVVVPILNLAVPQSSGLHMPTYLVALFGKYICYALLALSIDLIWGYCGILSLGHGAFFALPGALAFVFGWFAFRSRVTGVYLSIITQALTYALMLGFFRNNFGFGGNNGLTDFKDILGFNVQAPGTRAALFTISAVALMLGFVICRAIVASKFGKVLIAIRDAESRTRFLGYRVESYKLFIF